MKKVEVEARITLNIITEVELDHDVDLDDVDDYDNTESFLRSYIEEIPPRMYDVLGVDTVRIDNVNEVK